MFRKFRSDKIIVFAVIAVAVLVGCGEYFASHPQDYEPVATEAELCTGYVSYYIEIFPRPIIPYHEQTTAETGRENIYETYVKIATPDELTPRSPGGESTFAPLPERPPPLLPSPPTDPPIITSPVDWVLPQLSVTPVFPENQYPYTVAFLDLRVTAGQRQELSVTLDHSGDEDVSVGITFSNSYGADIAFTDIASLTIPYIVIPAGFKIDVPIILSIPAEGFDGVIIGTIYMSERPSVEIPAGVTVRPFMHGVVVRLQIAP